MCHLGVSNEGRSTAHSGWSKGCKWLFNEVSVAPRCHAVVHSEAEMGRFLACFKDNHPKRSGRRPVCHVGVSSEGRSSSTSISCAMSKTRTQLGPSLNS